jgi:hypothetical protein
VHTKQKQTAPTGDRAGPENAVFRNNILSHKATAKGKKKVTSSYKAKCIKKIWSTILLDKLTVAQLS